MDDLEKSLEKFLKNFSENLEDELGRVAEITVQTAKRKVPVRTGKLRDSIDAEVSRKGWTIEVDIWASEPYAAFVENGTSKSPPQPFMKPAKQEAERRLPEAVQRAFRKSKP